MGGFAQYTQPKDDSSRWRPVIVAAVCIVIVGVIVWALSRGTSKTPTQSAVPPYAASLQVGDLHLSTAENFVGGHVTYLEGKVVNAGDKTLTGADVQTVFRNTLGEIVDEQTQSLRIASSPLGNPDWVALASAPLAPGKTAEFRLTFEHISADWNIGYPELKFVTVQTK